MLPLLPAILFVSTFCFACGILLPLVQVERLFVFTDEPSLIGIVSGLWNEGDMLLSAAIALFSLVFPGLKLLLLHLTAYSPKSAANIPGWFRALANWSMLDVVLVALVIFAAKSSGVATAFTKPGLWFFAASVLLTATASALSKRGPEER